MNTHFMDAMDSSGHTKVTWDPEDKDSVKVARETFTEMLKKGYQAFKILRTSTEKKGERIQTFDPMIGEILLVPQLRGG